MCGIAGFFGKRQVSPASRQAMLAALANRGPDAAHEVAWSASRKVESHEMASSALLHARLAIRDPRPIADQPMVSDDGKVWLCYNGEIYGWEEEAEALAATGKPFHTRSDTEFILRAYLTWGFPGLLDHLRGMFAITIVDWRLGQVFLVRDRLGLKPLVYGVQPDGIAFGSTVRALVPWLPTDKREFSADAIDAYLAHRHIPAPRTIFTNLRRLENAHYLIYDLASGHLEKKCYWSMPVFGNDSVNKNAKEEALEELKLAVNLRTVADRPLGLFLSGGIDSSTIACILSDAGHTELSSFTASFPGSNFDESAEAAEISEVLGLSNTAIPIPMHLGSNFDRIVADLDEPFADPSSIPTWFLARETVKHVTVVLGGDGGDEIFAGYKRHPKHLRTRWRAGVHLPMPPISSLDGRGWRRLAEELSLPWGAAYTMRFSGFSPAQRRFLQSAAHLKQDVWWRSSDTATSTPLDQLLANDLANTLPEYILRKADLCTMAHGLELRAPLLDHRWLEKLASVPPNLRFTNPAKLFLAGAMKKLAPLALFQRNKRGFNPPLSDWLQKDLRERADNLGEKLSVLSRGQLKEDAVNALVAAYYSGKSHLAEQVLQLLLLDESLRQLDCLRGKA